MELLWLLNVYFVNIFDTRLKAGCDRWTNKKAVIIIWTNQNSFDTPHRLYDNLIYLESRKRNNSLIFYVYTNRMENIKF